MEIPTYDFYENLDATYKNPFHPSHKKMKLVSRYVRPGGTLIDIGCGTGEFIVQLKDRFITVVGTDVNQHAIDFSAKKAGRNEGVLLYQGELGSLHFPSEKFDVCLCLDVLEHAVDLFQLIREIYRILRLGGELIVTVPNWYDIIVSKILRRNPYHVNTLTPWSWMAILRKGGFKIQCYRAVDFPLLKSDFLARKIPFLGMCIFILGMR